MLVSFGHPMSQPRSVSMETSPTAGALEPAPVRRDEDDLGCHCVSHASLLPARHTENCCREGTYRLLHVPGRTLNVFISHYYVWSWH